MCPHGLPYGYGNRPVPTDAIGRLLRSVANMKEADLSVARSQGNSQGNVDTQEVVNALRELGREAAKRNTSGVEKKVVQERVGEELADKTTKELSTTGKSVNEQSEPTFEKAKFFVKSGSNLRKSIGRNDVRGEK